MPEITEILTRMTPGKFDATRAANFDIERAKGVLESSFGIERMVAFDEETRTAEFSFGTDQPIEHWFGMVALDVSKKAVVVDRIENGVAPFLVNHSRNQHCGVIVKDSLELGPSIRGKAKFSRSQLGEDMFNDVKDEIRVGTSLGFVVHDMELTNEQEVRKGAIPQYRVTKWEILEVSLASIPADIGCGSNRAFEREQPILPPPSPESRANSNSATENTMTEAERLAAEAANPTAAPAVVETRTPAQIAVAGLRAWQEAMPNDAPAIDAYIRENLADNGTFTGTEAGLFAAIRAAQPPPANIPVPPVPGQLARALPRYGTLRNFVGDNAAERAHRFGQWILAMRGVSAGMSNEGAFKRSLSFCNDNGIVVSRAMSEGVNESGGFLVPEEFGNDLIDLREIYGVFRRNAKIVPMASDSRSDPRRTGGLTAYFAGEGDAITASDKSWDRVNLAAEKLTCLARYSNEVNEDAVISMGDDLAGEIAYAFATKEDACGFIGDGTDTYGGMQGVTTKIKGLNGTIANIAGLTVATGTGYASSYGAIVLTDFEAVVGNLPVYADTARAKWYVHKSFYWNVMARLALAAGGVTGSEIEGSRTKRFLGYDVEFVQILPKTPAVSQVAALLGDLSLAASFGSRRDTTIAVSEHSRFANDQLEIRGTERFDINVHDVGNASATAGLRVAGPIVGLITAAS